MFKTNDLVLFPRKDGYELGILKYIDDTRIPLCNVLFRNDKNASSSSLTDLEQITNQQEAIGLIKSIPNSDISKSDNLRSEIKAGDLVVYKDKMELGIVKKRGSKNAFVYYHSGDTTANTKIEDLNKIINVSIAYTIKNKL